MKIGIKSLLLCASALAFAPTADAQTAGVSTSVRTTTTTTHVSSRASRHRAYRAHRVVRRRSRGGAHASSSQTTTSTSTTTQTSHTYAPEREYREGGQYQERVLTAQDRVYAGEDGRYYCRRPDGTTGLIVGGAAGALLGNVLTKGGSSTLGTILGAGAGALAGRAVEQHTVHCR